MKVVCGCASWLNGMAAVMHFILIIFARAGSIWFAWFQIRNEVRSLLRNKVRNGAVIFIWDDSRHLDEALIQQYVQRIA